MKMQESKKPQKVDLEEYSELIKTVARVESSRLSTPVLDFSELMNIGAITVYVILSSKPKNYHNNSYISTAIKWAIRNELRRRYKWYSHKYSSKKNDCLFPGASRNGLREAVYETILSIDELQQTDNSIQIEDESLNPEQKIELFELKNAINESLELLTDKERCVLEAKFFQNKKIKEIAGDCNVSSSRVSKIINASLDKIKANLIKKGII